MVFLLERDFEKNHTGKSIGLREKSCGQKRNKLTRQELLTHLAAQTYAKRLVHGNHIATIFDAPETKEI
jgi:hypothetical protein